MHPPSADKPTQAQLVFPVLETLHEMGGRGRARDVGTELARRFKISSDVLQQKVTTGDGQQVDLWQRHVRFAREKAKSLGYLASESHGLWQLTDEGREGIGKASAAIVVTILTDENEQPCRAQIDISVGIPTIHTLHRGDARDMSWIGDGEIPLIVTSCPYFDLVDYTHAPGQLSEFADYNEFLHQLDAVWRECYRVLMPGGRLACNVGDVLRSRKRHGTHHVLPLHADIITRSRSLGFLPLTGIVWSKLTNCSYEQGPGGVLGKPGQPNGVIKSELEHVLLLKKPGPYRTPTRDQQEASRITKEEYAQWFRPIWDDIPGARGSKDHPCPFPVSVPYRLTRMFSFVGDTVLDPFAGSFSTTIGSMRAGRNSVGVEIGPNYFRAGLERAKKEAAALVKAAA